LRAQRWATEHFKRGWWRRAMRHYKKAMLDLEVPIQWHTDAQLVERNQLRVALHLNAAACALKLPPERSYPDLQAPSKHYDVHHDAIFHCTKVLDADKHNVKALYRRALAHLLLPNARHINGLALATADLQHALECDPQNAEVRKELKRARELQKRTDRDAASMFTKMISAGVEV
jgi:FK506-binding protein 4/5